MHRILETELMEEEEQVNAYAHADFEEPHGNFIESFGKAFPKRPIEGLALDLGCGPGDISFRFAAAFPECVIHAVDGSHKMLEYARRRLESSQESCERIRFIQGMLPNVILPSNRYDWLISNSLLHHLPDPNILWTVVKQYSSQGSGLFVMDLLRPKDQKTAQLMVETHAANEPEILKRDFYNSLLAAFTLDEVSEQLRKNGLDYLHLEQTSDRHYTVSGYRLPETRVVILSSHSGA